MGVLPGRTMKTFQGRFVLFGLALALGFGLSAPQTGVADSFLVTGLMVNAVAGTSTLLPNGKVLVAGDADTQSELYDPTTGTWATTGAMTSSLLGGSTATLLTNGLVLVTGGEMFPPVTHYTTSAAELYNPATGTWAAAGSMTFGRAFHTSTLLQNGKVLVTGGFGTSGNSYTNSELYDPVAGTWTVSSLVVGLQGGNTATLLPNGKVLVAGGEDGNGHSTSTCQLFDPATGQWTATGSMISPRYGHIAILLPRGVVLVAGGINSQAGPSLTYLSSAEEYDPSAGTWSPVNTMTSVRYGASATLLPNGTVLVAGGGTSAITFLSSTEIYNPPANSWTPAAAMNASRFDQTATLLPSGRVLIAGGDNNSGAMSEAELYDYAAGSWTQAGTTTNLPAGNLNTTTVLPNGRALVVGDTSAALYNPATGSWSGAGTLTANRSPFHTATLLSTGQVLVTGGYGVTGTELYNPVSSTWTATGQLNTNRYLDTVVSLANGKVLAFGGTDTNGNYVTSTEIYDPATGQWSLTGPLPSIGMVYPGAVLLPNGKVLAAGGYNNNPIANAELYDPNAGTWTAINPMVGARLLHTMTLLPNGNVLAAGGDYANTYESTNAEIFNPTTQTWTLIGPMLYGHFQHTATLINGKVLLTQGNSGVACEYYDPATGRWIATGLQSTYRDFVRAALLPNGKVLLAGNLNDSGNTAELFDPGLGYSSASQPLLASASFMPAPNSNVLAATGSNFRGVSEAAKGDNQSSPADYPLVQLRNLESEQSVFLSATNWSTNSFSALPVTNFPPGYAMATVFVNGTPSQSQVLLAFGQKTPAIVTLGNLAQTYDGAAEPVTVTTSPPGLAVSVIYNGAFYPPTNAGSYTVIAVVTDPAYTGGATNTLVIAPALASVTLGNLFQSADGTPKNVSVTTAPPGLPVNVTYNGSATVPTAAGSYTVVATISNPNYLGEVTNTLTVVSGFSVDVTHAVRTVDPRLYGVNAVIWDGYFDTPDTSNALQEIGCRTLRFPGGSLSDEYNWATDTSLTNTWQWQTSFNDFMQIATNHSFNVFITANYGTGTSNEAADWVRCANITNHCGYQYWEVGNECYGSWETDYNTNPPFAAHDPWTYAMRFQQYYSAMKAADPTVKVGIMVTPGEDYYGTGLHYVTNSRTGLIHYGWTPVLLSTLSSLGVTPDFAVEHFYPEYNTDSDAYLLQVSTNWVEDAANLRQQISDYCGPAGTNIELVCTENNNDAGSDGRQSTSLVNGLYLADSISQILKTEFNAYIWWDLRNGPDTSGDFDPSLYGWRTNGDEGIILNLNTRYPTFYTMKMIQFFAQPGDTILNPASGDALLSVYSAQHIDGSVSVLVISKDPTNSYTRNVTLNGFAPNSAAIVRSYGMPQDNATESNSVVPGAQDIATNTLSGAGTTFSYSFAPYSLTLFSLSPASPALLVTPPTNHAGNMFVFQLHGQPGVPYVLESSPDLANWTPVVTNRMAGTSMNVTNPIVPATPKMFWRAIWQP
jgi:N-acetylneuraminic acid mutarotase